MTRELPSDEAVLSGDHDCRERVIGVGRELYEDHGDDASVEWAVMNLIEGHSTRSVTVGYSFDRKLFGQYGPEGDLSAAEWWAEFPPIEGTRFRIFYPEDLDRPPATVRSVMAAIGAVPVGIFENDDKDSYDHRGRDSAHYLLSDHAPFRSVFRNKISED